MNSSTLEILWYLVIGFSIVAYTVLDGFDLGVGILHGFVKKDEDRRIFLNAIGPFWDGNEVWLVIVGGGLFAGFPEVYATLSSGFYDFFMFLLAALICRAVAIEFRSKRTSKRWRSLWDSVFCIASLMIAFAIGVILGNLIEGIPLDQHKDFRGSFSLFFRPYPLLIGLTSIALFTMHGAIYLVMKTEKELQKRLRTWTYRAILFFALCYFITTLATVVYMPFMVEKVKQVPELFIFPVFAFFVFSNIPREFAKGREMRAFLCSCIGIALLLLVFGIGTYPVIVRSSIHPNYDLTIFNASASYLTLKVLLIIVLLGVPLVLAYGAYIYKVFRGKVKIGPTSY